MSETTTTVDPVKQKIADIRAAGKEAFEQGKVKLFPGFPPELAHRANVSLKMTALDDLESCIKEIRIAALGIFLRPFTAGRNFPLHLTLLEADCSQEQWWKLGDLWKKIDTLLQENESVYWDSELQFSDIVLSGSGETLCMANHIPENIKRLREEITKLYVDYGLKVRSMNDIMHMTLQRLWVGEGATPERLRMYREHTANILLLSKPTVSAQPKSVYRGPAITLIENL
jgi:2'-5' RNA ligase